MLLCIYLSDKFNSQSRPCGVVRNNSTASYRKVTLSAWSIHGTSTKMQSAAINISLEYVLLRYYWDSIANAARGYTVRVKSTFIIHDCFSHWYFLTFFLPIFFSFLLILSEKQHLPYGKSCFSDNTVGAGNEDGTITSKKKLVKQLKMWEGIHVFIIKVLGFWGYTCFFFFYL